MLCSALYNISALEGYKQLDEIFVSCINIPGN